MENPPLTELEASARMTEEIHAADSWEKITEILFAYFKAKGFTNIRLSCEQPSEKGSDPVQVNPSGKVRLELSFKKAQVILEMQMEPGNIDKATADSIGGYRQLVNSILNTKSDMVTMESKLKGELGDKINNPLAVIGANIKHILEAVEANEIQLNDECLDSSKDINLAFQRAKDYMETMRERTIIPCNSEDFDLSSSPQEAAEKKIKDIKVLHIDDDVTLTRILRKTLRSMEEGGPELTSIQSGEEAIGKLETEYTPDIIYCDVMMPGVSGLAVYAWIEENRPELKEGFYFVTGGSFKGSDMLKAPIIHKPYKAVEVETPILNLLKKRD